MGFETEKRLRLTGTVEKLKVVNYSIMFLFVGDAKVV